MSTTPSTTRGYHRHHERQLPDHRRTSRGRGPSSCKAAASTRDAFGGAWSVDSGILQVGPFVSTTAAITTASGGTLAGQWAGAGGEVINALGFKWRQNSTGR